ncbi:MAG: hypothetical protein HUU32_21790 [Calditrichaceae bacterium]|nr:hypothetical protein [Calditrichia bacterium]NUQ44029.1 hypothetical protein [Calditrichaceae bacterium]
MKESLKNLVLILIAAAIAIFIYVQFFDEDKEALRKAREEIKETLAKSDSLAKENEKIYARIDSLMAERLSLIQKIDSLRVESRRKTTELKNALRGIYEYHGTLDSLSRELNELAKSPPINEPE